MNTTTAKMQGLNQTSKIELCSNTGEHEAITILKYVILSAIFITSLCGNCFVCWVVWKRLRMRTVMNFYLVNLAVADLAFTVICIPFDIPVQENSCVWPYFGALCKALFPLQTMCAYASVFTLTAIGFSRYRAIVHPLKPQMGLAATKRSIVAIWIISFVLVLPYVLVLQLDLETGHCAESWPEPKDTYSRVYSVTIFITEYAVPLTVVFGSYVKICAELRKNGASREDSSTQPYHAHDAEKVLKMSIVVTVVFALCSLPNHIVWLALDFSENNCPQCNTWVIVANTFVFVNSAADPVVYTIFNEKYREEFKRVIRRVKRRKTTRELQGTILELL